jgi:hypothetical protein
MLRSPKADARNDLAAADKAVRCHTQNRLPIKVTL